MLTAAAAGGGRAVSKVTTPREPTGPCALNGGERAFRDVAAERGHSHVPEDILKIWTGRECDDPYVRGTITIIRKSRWNNPRTARGSRTSPLIPAPA